LAFARHSPLLLTINGRPSLSGCHPPNTGPIGGTLAAKIRGQKVPVVFNQFWIAANIIFDLATGKTSQVLMLVNRPTDATIFASEPDAQNYYNFVIMRAQNIQWFLEGPTPQRPQGWVIRGQQVMQTQPVLPPGAILG
jgi:hypothetical protein